MPPFSATPNRRSTQVPALPESPRVLLVCFRFATPHHTGGFRWRALTKALVDAGWRVDVIAEAADDVPASRPDTPGADVADPKGLRVHRVSQRWPLRQLRLRWRHRQGDASPTDVEPIARAVTESVDPATVPVQAAGQPMGLIETCHATVIGLLDLADGWVWMRRARRLACRLAQQKTFDVVVATSPHHLTHRVAAAVARRFGVPYVADYRDPWYFGRGPGKRRLDPVTRRIWRHLETNSLRAATAVVDIAEGAQREAVRELAAVHPTLARLPRFYLANGWEPGPVSPPDPQVFRIVYTGWIWPFMPLPDLLAACGVFRRRNGLDADRFRVELVGVETHFNGVPVAAIARGAGLDDCFEARGRVPRAEADAAQDRAAVSIAFDSVCAHGICIPSKLYHCARRLGEVLPIGHPAGAMADEAAKIGIATCRPDDHEAIVARLEAAWQRWSQGAMTTPADAHGFFDVRQRGQEMVTLLEAIRRGEDLHQQVS